MHLAKVSLVISILVIFLLSLTMAQGQYQVVDNSNFKDGLRSWEVFVVKRDEHGPRAPYPRIEPIGNCDEYFASSEDSFCISFDTPYYSDGYIRQVVDIPPGSAYLELNFRQRSSKTVLYVTLIDLATGRSITIIPTKRPWLSPVSDFAGSRVEVRIGARGDYCEYDCYTYLDYVKIFVTPQMETTTSTITTIYTVYETVTYHVTQTSTFTLSTISTQMFTKTVTSCVTSTVTKTDLLETTITHLTTQTIRSTFTKYTTQIITISEVVQRYVGNAFDAVISLGLPLSLSSFAGIVVFYSLKKSPKMLRTLAAILIFIIGLPAGTYLTEKIHKPSAFAVKMPIGETLIMIYLLIYLAMLLSLAIRTLIEYMKITKK
ncbi:hypothetical protein DRO64_04680 [Candidatus Bathyarchaeota archaeon]|nr:MAG: hypothetical protein DRO64_04680 [Candidatus Bathyarchaeota archaeon]